MKIKSSTSLRLYLMLAIGFLSLTLVLGYSVLAANFFISGMDAVLEGSMREMGRLFADGEIGQEQNQINLGKYIMVKNWNDLPESIRAEFPEANAETDEFLKDVEGSGLLQRPDKATFIMPVTNQSGTRVYVARQFIPSQLNQEAQRHHSNRMPPPERSFYLLVGISAVVIISVIVAALFLLRAISQPLGRLAYWAKHLDDQNLKQPLPNFRYRELNDIASLVQGSLITVRETLDREKMFLGYASHELRTPIATIKNNLELMRRIHKNWQATEIQVLERLERASQTMGDLINTLLWLSRQNEAPPAEKPYRVDQQLAETIEELSYLLKGKNGIEIHSDLRPTWVATPSIPLKIILNNLVRNAYQHTQQGDISIQLVDDTIIIRNPDSDCDQEHKSSSGLGFGLGLMLIERLSQRMGLHFKLQREKDDQVAKLKLPVIAPPKAVQ